MTYAVSMISENVSHSQIASSPFLRDDNKIPNFTPPQIEEKEKSNSSLSTTGESDANEVNLHECNKKVVESCYIITITQSKSSIISHCLNRLIPGGVLIHYGFARLKKYLDHLIGFLLAQTTSMFKLEETIALMKGIEFNYNKHYVM